MDLQGQPATKADVQALRLELEPFEQRLYDRMDLMEQRIAERLTGALGGMESRLIEGFNSFAEINTKRLTQAELIRLPPLG